MADDETGYDFEADKGKTIEPETLFYESENESARSFDTGLVVGGFPTSVEHDPTTHIIEALGGRGTDSALVTLNLGDEAIDREKGPVFNTSPEIIFDEIREAVEMLDGETAVFGYCCGGSYALESGVMDRNDVVAFVGSDIPAGMQSYEGLLEPETDGVVFYDDTMEGRLDARQVEVTDTHHIWQNTPEDFGEAQVDIAEALAYDGEAENFQWMEETDRYSLPDSGLL
ncbi:hypothetical protein ACK3SF_02640 [Candidatus Nanosalina sp. VS9-1]|uniref:hypothetical protein n=1 Tax=Candidatus Nanosalina sp. VS9-1 TaxID=3388566 RepID=UPI0039E0D8FB